MLSTLLKGTGTVLLILGAASMDSPCLAYPTVITLVGCALLLIGRKEDGCFRKKNRPR